MAAGATITPAWFMVTPPPPETVLRQVQGASLSLERSFTFSPRLKRNESSSSVQNYFHLDSLQKKLKDLEEENVVLRSEVKCTPCPCCLWRVVAGGDVLIALLSRVTICERAT